MQTKTPGDLTLVKYESRVGIRKNTKIQTMTPGDLTLVSYW